MHSPSAGQWDTGDRSSYVPIFDLTGRLAVVTGASQGIGEALSLCFGRMGARLALATRDRLRLDGLMESLKRHSVEEVEAYEIDLRSIGEIGSFVREVSVQQGCPTILVNCAGEPFTRDAFDVTEEDWDRVLDIGLKSLFFTSVGFAKEMSVQGYGKIINLSSTYATSVAPKKSVYAIAKGGVSQVTRALAVEWADLGIRVNALAPPLTDTPTRRGVFEDEERLKAIRARIPLGRPARTDDLLGAASFLASEASDYITGHTMYVDGGWHALG